MVVSKDRRRFAAPYDRLNLSFACHEETHLTSKALEFHTRCWICLDIKETSIRSEVMASSRLVSLVRILTSSALLLCFCTCGYAQSTDFETFTENNGFTTPTGVESPAPCARDFTTPTLRVGGYLGALSQQGFLNTLYAPWRTHLEPNYLADIHAVYTVDRCTRLPLDIEVEGGIAKRFGEDHQIEVDLAPVVRWKQFPWNEYLYTNLRVGLVGASYVNSISSWEQENSDNGRGSRFLNFLVPELTFASAADASWESLIRIHHRSGIYGMINGVQGGSNYISVGIRFVAF